MKFLLICLLVCCLKTSVVFGDEEKESDDTSVSVPTLHHLCNFDKHVQNATIDYGDGTCDCDVVLSVVIGRPLVKIDCAHIALNLTNEVFKAEKLPVTAISLILSYHRFAEIPSFVGEKLTTLDMSNNQISTVKDFNFIGIKALETLDISYNFISSIEPNAFSQLNLLRDLDLTSNHLKTVPLNVFQPLLSLNILKLSSNGEFVNTVMNSMQAELFLNLGVTTTLKHIELKRCNLTKVNLLHGIGLENVNLGFNDVTNFIKLDLPPHIKTLDISGNPIRELKANYFSHFYNVEELIMEDLPFLGQLEENSLFGMPKLRHLSLEGTKNLTLFHPNALGVHDSVNGSEFHLKVLNLRGCNLLTLNSDLSEIFNNLEQLHLEGNKFHCDCELQWMKDLDIKVNLQCSKPEELSGQYLFDIDEDDLKCKTRMSNIMKKVVNTLILLVLLVGCSLAIWCFFRQLNLRDRKGQHRKVGPESPYQRVTIEPNRAEYSLH